MFSQIGVNIYKLTYHQALVNIIATTSSDLDRCSDVVDGQTVFGSIFVEVIMKYCMMLEEEDEQRAEGGRFEFLVRTHNVQERIRQKVQRKA